MVEQGRAPLRRDGKAQHTGRRVSNGSEACSLAAGRSAGGAKQWARAAGGRVDRDTGVGPACPNPGRRSMCCQRRLLGRWHPVLGSMPRAPLPTSAPAQHRVARGTTQWVGGKKLNQSSRATSRARGALTSPAYLERPLTGRRRRLCLGASRRHGPARASERGRRQQPRDQEVAGRASTDSQASAQPEAGALEF